MVGSSIERRTDSASFQSCVEPLPLFQWPPSREYTHASTSASPWSSSLEVLDEYEYPYGVRDSARVVFDVGLPDVHVVVVVVVLGCFSPPASARNGRRITRATRTARIGR